MYSTINNVWWTSYIAKSKGRNKLAQGEKKKPKTPKPFYSSLLFLFFLMAFGSLPKCPFSPSFLFSFLVRKWSREKKPRNSPLPPLLLTSEPKAKTLPLLSFLFCFLSSFLDQMAANPFLVHPWLFIAKGCHEIQPPSHGRKALAGNMGGVKRRQKQALACDEKQV